VHIDLRFNDRQLQAATVKLLYEAVKAKTGMQARVIFHKDTALTDMDSTLVAAGVEQQASLRVILAAPPS
jgi:hypothetical protein